MTTTLDMARFYDGLGISVIPLKPNSKTPAIQSWKPYQDRRADHDQLVKWFGGGKRNIASVCGFASENLGVRDFDVEASYEAWQAKFPDLAETLPTVKTARGRHVYCRTAEPVKSSCLDDGEFRSDGCYVVSPPSLHPDGITYTWTKAPHDWIPIIDPISAGLVPEYGTQAISGLGDACVPSKGSSRSGPARSHSSVGSLNGTRAVSGESTDATELFSDLVTRAIRKTQPTKAGQRNNCLFHLAQYLKQISAQSKVEELYPVVQRWYVAALPVIQTKDFNTTWKDFCIAWKNVRFAKGTALQSAAAAADESLIPASVEGASKRKLAAICLQLQLAQGTKPFFLDCRNAALLVGTSFRTAHRMLRALCDQGVLRKESTGSFASGRANEYTFVFLADT